MSATNPRIDAYIAKAEPFAQPILQHIRKVVHAACPQVEEKIKWSFPHFDYKGKMMCSMAAFKAHCAFTFWNAAQMQDDKKIFIRVGETAMGQLGRITSIKDLPSDTIFKAYIKEAMQINDAGIVVPRSSKPTVKTDIEIPDYFQKTLNGNKAAKATFEKMPPSHKKEYVEWITGARTETTRQKRISTALEWLADGKSRNWQYNK